MKRIVHIGILISFFHFSFFISSCERVLDVDDNMPDRQMVLNAIPSAGDTAFVYFAYTHFFLDNNNDNPVPFSAMTLSVNGVPYYHCAENGCCYFFPYVLQPDDTLAIDIQTADCMVHAATYVPQYPDISNMRVTRFESPSFNFYRAQFELSDHPGYPEYYRLKVMVRDSGERYNAWERKLDTVDTIHSTYFVLPTNPEITSNEVNPYIPLGGYLYNTAMFLDRKIEGRSNYPVDMYILMLVDTNEVQPFKHWYKISVESVTPARWNYLLSASSSSGMNSMFAEQGQPYGNVEGALGIFAGRSKWEYEFDADTIKQ